MTNATPSRLLSNTDDVIDTRDVQERIDELQAMEMRDENEEAELQTLEAFAADIRDACPDYHYGETLIHDRYFVEYARELASDIGAIQPKLSWPYTCIDWQAAADELRHDYTSAEFDGETYWFRQY